MKRSPAQIIREYGPFEGVDAVLLISSSEVGHRIAQHRSVIDAARNAGVSKFVYTSAPRATTTDLVLAPEHKATEEAIVASGLPSVILRNNWYTENYASDLEAARATGVLAASTGAGRVASASRRDFAALASSARWRARSRSPSARRSSVTSRAMEWTTRSPDAGSRTVTSCHE